MHMVHCGLLWNTRTVVKQWVLKSRHEQARKGKLIVKHT